MLQAAHTHVNIPLESHPTLPPMHTDAHCIEVSLSQNPPPSDLYHTMLVAAVDATARGVLLTLALFESLARSVIC